MSVVCCGCGLNKHRIIDAFSQKQHYDFRKVRWGMSQSHVELAEQGHIVVRRTPNELIYKVKVDDVSCQVLYTFRKNKLRAAGYITPVPSLRAKKLIKKCLDTHGTPTQSGSNGMTWKGLETVVYSHYYVSWRRVTPTKYTYSEGGLLQHLLAFDELPKGQAGVIDRFDAIFTYVDRAFYDYLHEIDRPLDDLSFYEKQLMGIVLRRPRVELRGTGITIPSH